MMERWGETNTVCEAPQRGVALRQNVLRTQKKTTETQRRVWSWPELNPSPHVRVGWFSSGHNSLKQAPGLGFFCRFYGLIASTLLWQAQDRNLVGNGNETTEEECCEAGERMRTSNNYSDASASSEFFCQPVSRLHQAASPTGRHTVHMPEPTRLKPSDSQRRLKKPSDVRRNRV